MRFQISDRRRRTDEKNNSFFILNYLKSRHAFTLIEIMVSIVIFSLVIASIYATWMLIMRASQVGQTAAARAQRQRIVMGAIENSLMCVQSFQASQKYYTFIVANGDAPMLSFAACLPNVFPRSGKFINEYEGRDFNLRRVTFTLEPGTDRQNNLVLRQNPILMDMDDDEQKNPLILARDVKTFAVECWDTNQLEWVTEWDNTNAIPPMVRVSLVLGGDDAAGGNASASSDADSQRTIIRAFSLPSSTMPAAVQMGIGGLGQQPLLAPPVQPTR
jgi:prepilin-type N-terminal cleavage/methylation domain-containing protein